MKKRYFSFDAAQLDLPQASSRVFGGRKKAPAADASGYEADEAGSPFNVHYTSESPEIHPGQVTRERTPESPGARWHQPDFSTTASAMGHVFQRQQQPFPAPSVASLDMAGQYHGMGSRGVTDGQTMAPFHEPPAQLYPYPFPRNDDERERLKAQRLKSDLDQLRYGSPSPIRATISNDAAQEALLMEIRKGVVAQLALDAPRLFDLVQRQYAMADRVKRSEHSVTRQRSLERMEQHGGEFVPFTQVPCDIALRAVFTVKPRASASAALDKTYPIDCASLLAALESAGQTGQQIGAVERLIRMCRTCVNPMNIAVQKRRKELLRATGQSSSAVTATVSATGDENPAKRREFVCWVTIEQDSPERQLLFTSFVVLDGANASPEPLWVDLSHLELNSPRRKGRSPSAGSHSTRDRSPNQGDSRAAAARRLHKELGDGQSISSKPDFTSNEMSVNESIAAKQVFSRSQSASLRRDFPEQQQQQQPTDSTNVISSPQKVAVAEPESASGSLLVQAEMMLKQLRQYYFQPVANNQERAPHLPLNVVLKALADCNIFITKAATHLHNQMGEANQTITLIHDETLRIKEKVAGLTDGALEAVKPSEKDPEGPTAVATLAMRRRELHNGAMAAIQQELARAEGRLALLEQADIQSNELFTHIGRDVDEEMRRSVAQQLWVAREEQLSRMVDADTGDDDTSEMLYDLGYQMLHVREAAVNATRMEELEWRIQQLLEENSSLALQLSNAQLDHEAESQLQREEILRLEAELSEFRRWSTARDEAESKDAQTDRRPSMVSLGVQFEEKRSADVHSRSAGVTPQISIAHIDRALSAMAGPAPKVLLEVEVQTFDTWEGATEEAYALAALELERQFEERERALCKAHQLALDAARTIRQMATSAVQTVSTGSIAAPSPTLVSHSTAPIYQTFASSRQQTDPILSATLATQTVLRSSDIDELLTSSAPGKRSSSTATTPLLPPPSPLRNATTGIEQHLSPSSAATTAAPSILLETAWRRMKGDEPQSAHQTKAHDPTSPYIATAEASPVQHHGHHQDDTIVSESDEDDATTSPRHSLHHRHSASRSRSPSTRDQAVERIKSVLVAEEAALTSGAAAAYYYPEGFPKPAATANQVNAVAMPAPASLGVTPRPAPQIESSKMFATLKSHSFPSMVSGPGGVRGGATVHRMPPGMSGAVRNESPRRGVNLDSRLPQQRTHMDQAVPPQPIQYEPTSTTTQLYLDPSALRPNSNLTAASTNFSRPGREADKYRQLYLGGLGN